MNTQATPPEIVAHEQALVRKAARLNASEAVAFNDRGWDSRVYSIQGGRYFFKFPRSEKIRQRYGSEVQALELAGRNALGIQIPKVRWKTDEYFGYEGVGGESLRTLLPTLSADEREAIGARLGMFLRWFHQQRLSDARRISIDKEIEQFQEWFTPAVPTLKRAFGATLFQRLEHLVHEEWPARLKRLGYDPALCHGDLHLPNILFEPQLCVVGIIDFGDVGYYDRTKDLLEFEDDVVTDAAFKAYGVDDLQRQKITFRRATTNILTLTFCIGKKDYDGIQTVLERIRQTL